LAAARAWSLWEGETITLLPDSDVRDLHSGADFALAFSRIENHYFIHGGWLSEGQLLRDAGRLRGIPGIIIQGRYDMACPPASAYALHKAWGAPLVMVEDAGHAFNEPGILHQLINATDKFA
jgi:proline iminopeptidase